MTCWNVDTFEGGIGSKSGFLEKCAIEFEKENRGLYILVKNMTIDECLLQLKEGNKPDLLSFGEKFFDEFKPILAGDLESCSIKQIVKNHKITPVSIFFLCNSVDKIDYLC